MHAWEIVVGVGSVVILAILSILHEAAAKGASGSASPAKQKPLIPAPSLRVVAPGPVSTMHPLKVLVRAEAESRGVDPLLAAAVVQVESAWDATAVSPEDSYGLMQVLCEPDGSGGCKNRFDIVGWPPASAAALLDPRVNVPLGMQILAYDVHRYGTWQGVATYNDWGAREDPPDGPYRNQSYVDAVRKVYAGLRAAGIRSAQQ